MTFGPSQLCFPAGFGFPVHGSNPDSESMHYPRRPPRWGCRFFFTDSLEKLPSVAVVGDQEQGQQGIGEE
ncbi:hypothetical protein RchiOBHm_Chr1g0351701 [Rosa chinensis]|uniref:Uncharacterized protein n=1 Tax=Rosa chinensis TaxID=74649 RepID=A0A2P6SGI5_ROSCH|nr:hypothetical protein RchiOBHm_Chr1g0351701 [Rosa chinensis]